MRNLSYILKQDIITRLSESTIDELSGGRKAISTQPAIEGNDLIWQNQIPFAVEMVAGYIRHWYDAGTELRAIFEYDIAEAFTAGQRVASEEVDSIRTLYTCIQDAPIGTDLTDTDYFTEEDDRNTVLLECACLIVVYNTSRRINPRQIPEQRQIDYDRTIDILKDVQRGKIQLSIAEREEVEDDDPGHEIAFFEIEGLTQDDF